MDAIDLRCYPFCANETLTIASVIIEIGEVRCVKCPECGARGPMATGRDPLGHAAFLWNQRYGSDH
jgi:ssDNA-binding Zn-finger/Zn-ribbon topoisomerase 1